MWSALERQLLVQWVCIQSLTSDTVPFCDLGHFTFLWCREMEMPWKYFNRLPVETDRVIIQMFVYVCIYIHMNTHIVLFIKVGFIPDISKSPVYIHRHSERKQTKTCTYISYFVSHQTYIKGVLKGKEWFEFSLGTNRTVALSVCGSIQTCLVSELSVSDTEYIVL